jgi:uncharacterized membrane protein
MSDPGVPPGWTYDPSAWRQRLPLVVVAIAGALIAASLAAFQLGIVDHPWDPLFGDGSRTVLTSSVSDALPVPDAAVGFVGYLLDAVRGVQNGHGRWRTAPWIFMVFGVAVGPLGAVSLLLVMLQPLLAHAWCTLCVASALLSILMIGPAMDELLASVQYLRRVHRDGGDVWRAFWGAT